SGWQGRRTPADGPFFSSLLRPGFEAALEVVQLKQSHPRAARRGARVRRVVAPRRQEQAHVLEVGVRGDVQKGLQAVFDEPEARAPAVRRLIGGDLGAEVVA